MNCKVEARKIFQVQVLAMMDMTDPIEPVEKALMEAAKPWKKMAMALAYALEREGYPEQCFCKPEPDFEDDKGMSVHKNYCQENKKILADYELLRGGDHVHF